MRGLIKGVFHHRFLYPALSLVLHICRVLLCRYRYSRTLVRLRRKVRRGEKIKVLFLSGNVSKWKSQTIYELMSKSDLFDPLVGVTFPTDFPGDVTALERRVNDDMLFFTQHGDRAVLACDVESRQGIAPSQFGADIVFLQEPWATFKCQSPFAVSQYALTCYLPYSIEWIVGRPDLHQIKGFHLLLWMYVVLNVEYVRESGGRQPFYMRAGNVVPLGHAMMDAIVGRVTGERLGGKCVIYAPHFSFPSGNHKVMLEMSTFDFTGRAMLKYAQEHPEIKWLFKPHPALRGMAVSSGLMTAEEVDEYYRSWETIAEVCYDANYVDMFVRSSAMVTDSSSFLVEYAPLNKPIIRLRRSKVAAPAAASIESLFASYYEAFDVDQMKRLLSQVVEQGNDPLEEKRMSAARKANLFDVCASINIFNWIKERIVG